MRKIVAAFSAGFVLAVAPASAEPADREAELARALEGRVVGPPVDCVDLRRIRSSRMIPDTAILYDAGHTIYVNRPRAGADSLNQWDTIVTRTPTGRLCSIDSVTLVDLPSNSMTGVVLLGEFVPYRRVD
jgi:hypothetical protein